MKKTFILIFILYLVIFLGAGMVFYSRYTNKFFPIDAEPFQIEKIATKNYLYYSRANNIFRAEPITQAEPLNSEEIEKYSASGEIGKLDISRTKASFEIKNKTGFWEIWETNTENFQPNKLIYKNIEGLGDFDDFIKPQYSPDANSLAFIAKSVAFDVIFIQNLTDKSLTKIGDKLTAKISDYSWSSDSAKIIFCTSSLNPNSCWQTDLKANQTNKLFEAEARIISHNYTADIFYLAGADDPHLYRYSSQDSVPLQLDNLAAPKKIVNFQIDPTGKKIAYEVLGEQLSDIYLSNIDGTNRVQLTTSGQAIQPIFSFDGSQIAYLKQKDGLFLINWKKDEERKIVNLEDTIDQLLLWK